MMKHNRDSLLKPQTPIIQTVRVKLLPKEECSSFLSKGELAACRYLSKKPPYKSNSSNLALMELHLALALKTLVQLVEFHYPMVDRILR